MSTRSKRSSKKRVVKPRDPSWQLRHALGQKVEPNLKAYVRKPKHPKNIDDQNRIGSQYWRWGHYRAVVDAPDASLANTVPMLVSGPMGAYDSLAKPNISKKIT